MRNFFQKIGLSIFVVCACVALYLWYVEVEVPQASDWPEAQISISKGEGAREITETLKKIGVVRTAWLFRLYLHAKGIDRSIGAGEYTVVRPFTIAHVAEQLAVGRTNERTITILPGWGIRDIATYLVKEGIAKNEDEVYALAGTPAVVSKKNGSLTLAENPVVLRDKPSTVSFEGYFRPDTYRIFSDATVADVLARLVRERDAQFTPQMYADMKTSGHTVHDVLTLASILEKEGRGVEDKKIIADMFWRRIAEGWALQADSTVHYIFGDPDSVFTTSKERLSDNPWNTYKHKGLPPGPIANSSLDSIMAAIYPTKNSYNYFLTTLDTGEVKYARTLEEHNANRAKYLR